MSLLPPPPPPPPPGGMPPMPPAGYTPYAAAPPMGEYASFGARLGGYLLDSILYGLFAAIFIAPAAVLGFGAFKDCDRFTTSDGTRSITCSAGQLKGGLLAAGVAIGLVGFIIVAIVYLRALGRTGQTWGRRMVGIKVVSKLNGQPIGIGRALGRELFARTISGWICYLGYLWMLWDPAKQTWHDKVIDSVVVRA